MRQYTKRRPERGRRQRGAVLAMVGMAMVVIVAMAVVGVDVGRVAFTANEAQSLADVGAMSGAQALGQRLSSGNAAIDPDAEARAVMQQNSIGGGVASDANVESIRFGNWLGNGFVPGTLAGADAIEVTTTETVDNFFAGLFGTNQSSVRRIAVGQITPPTCAPVLPVAIGDCFFDFSDPSDCGSLPTIRLNPQAVQNGCWTSVHSVDAASASAFRSILPTACCGTPGCGGGTQPPVVSVDDTIRLQNGVSNSALNILIACRNVSPPIDFVVPIIRCNSGGGVTCTGDGTIIGFAVANVIGGQSQGANKYMDLDFKCGITPNCAGGGGTPNPFGGFQARMVQ